MRRTSLSLSAIVVGIVLGYAAVSYGQEGSAQPNYDPYPPGILPPNLDSETARVLREIDVIEGRAIKRWHSLPPPTLLPQRPGLTPPARQDIVAEAIET